MAALLQGLTQIFGCTSKLPYPLTACTPADVEVQTAVGCSADYDCVACPALYEQCGYVVSSSDRVYGAVAAKAISDCLCHPDAIHVVQISAWTTIWPSYRRECAAWSWPEDTIHPADIPLWCLRGWQKLIQQQSC